MRVPPNQLLVNSARDLREVEPPTLLGHPRVKHYLEQEVAQLVAQLRRVALLDCVSDLVGFFDRERRNRGKRLLLIPGTAALRIAQPRHEIDQCGDSTFGGAHPLGSCRTL
jgi:hypothetical protein